MTERDHSEDLAWTAFRYVADELSAEEAAAFEAQLADDQSARDAVVRAVQLTTAVASALPESTAAAKSTTPPPARRPILFVAAATACLVLLAVVLFRSWMSPPKPDLDGSAPPDTDEMASGSAVEAGHLVSLWVSDENEADDRTGRAELVTSTTDDGSQTELEFADEDRDAALIVPDWLLAAVSHDVSGEDSEFEHTQETN